MAQKKKPFTVDENIDVGIVQVTDSKGFKVSLTGKDGKRYISISKVYKSKSENKWKAMSGVWIPFEESKAVLEKAYMAFETGLRLKWGDENNGKNFWRNKRTREGLRC